MDGRELVDDWEFAVWGMRMGWRRWRGNVEGFGRGAEGVEEGV